MVVAQHPGSASLGWTSSSDSHRTQGAPRNNPLGTGMGWHCPWRPCCGHIPGTGSEIPLPTPHPGLVPTGSIGILGAGCGRLLVTEPWFNPNSPGTNFPPTPPPPFYFFFNFFFPLFN